MVVIEARSDDSLKAEFKEREGYDPTWFGHLLGRVGYGLFWWQMDSWAIFIKRLCPDWFPINAVEGFLVSVVKFIHKRIAYWNYRDYAIYGDKLTGEFEKIITDTKERIEAEIKRARAIIERDLINPIRDKINTEIEPKVKNVLDRIKTAEATVGKVEDRINDARRDLEKHTSDIEELFDRIKKLEGQTTEQTRLITWLKEQVGLR